MTENTSLNTHPSDTRKLLRRADILGTVLAFAWLAVVFFEGTPRVIRWGILVALYCFILARLVIQRGRPAPIPVTGRRAAGYLITAAACALAGVWFFAAGSWSYQLLLFAAIPLTLGAGEFFRWRARSRNL